MLFKEELKIYAREIGVAAIGITDVEPISEGLHIYEERIKNSYLTGGRKPRAGFEPPNLSKRVDPKKSFSEAKSIIVISVPYKISYVQKNIPTLAGNLARIGWGRDYHLLVAEKLRKLEQFLKDILGAIKTKAIVDTGPLLERSFAVRAGIGWIGKNNTLIVPKYGSFVYIGELLINQEIEPDEPLNIDCGKCTKCIDACPTNALVEPWMLNTRICMSYLTQVPELAPDWIIPLLDGSLYGCDICQDVCPYNIKAPDMGDPAFYPNKLLPKPDLVSLLSMNRNTYIDVVGETAVEWVGREILQKNALVALARYRNAEASKIIEQAKQDHRPFIRAAAQWSFNFVHQ